MSRFYGSIEGRRQNPATCCGTVQSGLSAHIRGWNIGVSVEMDVDDQGNDVVKVFQTGGSNSPQKTSEIAILKGDPE